jgi:CheY-specific phosphatase CheX
MSSTPAVTLDSVSDWLAQAVGEVCETMFSQVAVPVSGGPGPEASQVAGTLVTSIGFGGACDVDVAIHLPIALATRLASRVLDMPEAELDEAMVNDVGGEFGNMVVGAVKSRVTDHGVDCLMTLPKVVRGMDASVRGEQKRLGFRVGPDFLWMDVGFGASR